jgi:hypothetical protein
MFSGDLDSVSTNCLPWAEMLEFEFRKTFKISQLNRLRSFLKDGVTFNVVAVKHSYVLEDPKLSEEQNKEESASEKQSLRTSASKDPSKLDAKDGKKSGKAKVRFSPPERCERVSQSRMFMRRSALLLIHSFTSIKRRKSFM